MPNDQTLSTAIRHHQAGRLAEAEKIYRQLLAENPRNADALHLLGLLAHGAGQSAAAAQLIEQAIAADSRRPEFFCNLAEINRSLARFDAALHSAHQALALDPKSASAHYNLGLIYRDIKEPAQAIKEFQAALQITPNYPEALNNLGIALQGQQQLDAAVEAFQRLLQLHPDSHLAHNNLGVTFSQLKQLDAAVAAFQKSLAINPAFLAALTNLAVGLREQGQISESIDAYRRAVAVAPASADTHRNLALALLDAGNAAQAVASAQQAVNLASSSAVTHHALALAHAAAGDHRAAAEECRRAVALDPARQLYRLDLAIFESPEPLASLPTDYVRDLFDTYAPKFDYNLVTQLNYRAFDLFLQIILAHDPRRTFDTLDLGCGTGLCGAAIKPYANRLVGVDLSEAMIHKANERDVYDTLHVADLLPFLQKQTDSFDLILAGDVLVYLGDLSQLFSAITRTLRPAALFAFSIEVSPQPRFHLHSKHRFAHAPDYIRELAAQNLLTELASQQITLRTESNVPVPGMLFLLKNAAPTP